MQSRRSFLGALSLGLATSVAGCNTSTDDEPTASASSTAAEPATTTGAAATSTPTDTAERTVRTTTQGTAQSLEGEWSELDEMPKAQGDVGSAVLDGKLYVFGGIASGQGLDAVKRGFAYGPDDGAGGTWERIPDMPRALWGPSGVAADGAVYSFGGAPEDSPYGTDDPPSDEVFKFVPGEGWTDLTETRGVRCPYPTWAMRGVYNPDDGLVYNVCGATYSDADGQGNESRIWTFDPARDEVADPALTSVDEGKRWPSVSIVDVDGSPALHVIGGIGNGPSDDNLRYAIDDDEWSTMRRAPRSGMYATNNDPVIGNRVYLTHGLFWEGDLTEESYERACHRYDPVGDEWTTEGLPRPAYRRSAGTADAVIDGTLYVAGGHFKHYGDDGFHEALPYVEAFRPE